MCRTEKFRSEVTRRAQAECDALIRMVYDVEQADPEIMAKIDRNKDGEITIGISSRISSRSPVDCTQALSRRARR